MNLSNKPSHLFHRPKTDFKLTPPTKADPPQPPPSDPGPIGGADDPHWQCRIPQSFYGGFSGTPWHCQNAEMMRRSLEGDVLWATVWREQTPTYINIVITPGQFAPSGDSTNRTFAKMMKSATTSTTKPMIGEGDETTKDVGNITTVQIENPGPSPIDFTDSGGVSAEFGQKEKNVPLSPEKETTVGVAKVLLSATLESNTISGNCKKMVIDKLTSHFSDFNLASFVSFLQKPASFYDGEKSTVKLAGNVVSTVAAPSFSKYFGGASTVSELFYRNNSVTALASTTFSNLTVYFRPSYITNLKGDNFGRMMALVFHEAIHSYAGTMMNVNFYDEDILAAFGYDKNKIKTGEIKSVEISNYIFKHCFSGKQ